MYNGIVEKCRGPSGQPDGSSFYGGMHYEGTYELMEMREKRLQSWNAAGSHALGTPL